MSSKDRQVVDYVTHIERAREMRAQTTRKALVSLGNWMTGRSTR